MAAPRTFDVFQSPSAAARLDAAASVLRRLTPAQSVLVVAASRGAADDLVRRIARERAATVGLARFSLTQLAARVAAARLAADGIAPSTGLGAEAIAARASFDAARDGRLSYFGRVADTPGFPRALARTIGELRAVHASSARVASSGPAGEDLARLFDRIEREFGDAASADRARLFAVAADAFAGDPV